MGFVIRLFNKIVGNQYIFALFLFAIFIELILLPFGIKQQKNSIKQAKLRPKEMAIRKKYEGRDDNDSKQRVQQEIQALYQKEGYNPLSGCLPTLIQFPIIMALYYIVLNPLRYICQLGTDTINQIINVVNGYPEYADVTFTTSRTIDLMGAMKKIIGEHGTSPFSSIEGFTDKIGSASDLPNLELFGGAINLADTPSFKTFNWLLLIPILTFAAYFFSMKMNRKLMYQPTMGADDKAMGCSNKIMDYAMPLMSVYISFIVPAAIGVYWIFKSLIGVVKQVILHYAMPLPKFTDAEYKAAEKEYNSTRSEKVVKNHTRNPNVRSLHHIDDEDFADTAAAARARKEAEQSAAATDKPTENGGETDGKKQDPASGKSNGLIGSAPIKDDRAQDERRPSGKERRGKKKVASDVSASADALSDDGAKSGENENAGKTESGNNDSDSEKN